MNPDDIPTSITKGIYDARSVGAGFYPDALSQNDAAEILAHFWPAIREHFAQLLLDENPDRDADFTAGVDWASDTIRQAGAKDERPKRCMCGDRSGIPHPHPTWKDPSPRVLPASGFGGES